MTPSIMTNNNILNLTVNDGFTKSQVLAHPMIANEVWLTLTLSNNQKSPYFDLRGCNLEGKEKYPCQKYTIRHVIVHFPHFFVNIIQNCHLLMINFSLPRNELILP